MMGKAREEEDKNCYHIVLILGVCLASCAKLSCIIIVIKNGSRLILKVLLSVFQVHLFTLYFYFKYIFGDWYLYFH